jgi:hypothetical protein
LSDFKVFETGRPQTGPYFTIFETVVSDILRLGDKLPKVVSDILRLSISKQAHGFTETRSLIISKTMSI